MKALIDGDILKTFIDHNGYEVTTTTPRKYIHRLKTEKVLNRKLNCKEVIHHVDGNKSNNENSNLVICPNQSYHKLIHARHRIVELGGDPEIHHYCTYHCELHDKSEFSTTNSTWSGLHNMCKKATNEYRKNRGLNRDKFDWKARLAQQYRRIKKSCTNKAISWINPREESL